MINVFIAAATRTPVGGFNGSLSSVPAHTLGEKVIRDLVTSTHVDPAEISEVLMGQVLQGGAGQNPARQAARNAGLADEVTAMTINQVCGSGLRSVALAYQQIQLGDADIIIAGGQENMSQSPHVMHLRNPTKMGPATLMDSMITDGLWEAFYGYHMGITAENIAMHWQITRQEQDEFALHSQHKARDALHEGKFKDEMIPVRVLSRKKEIVVDTDEHPRPDVTLDDLAKLRPAFSNDGTVTAGNASGINDSAAAVMVMSDKAIAKYSLQPLARIVSWAVAGVDPALMGTGPIPASRKALEKAGWTHQELDIIEINEAFAAQSIAVIRDLGWDSSKINVNGGSIAIGHPIGASGARILCTLTHEMKRQNAQKGLATLCIGGGMGISLCVEREAT